MMQWESIKLGELYEVHNGLSKGREFFGSGYPFLTFSTVFNNYFIPDVLNDFVQTTNVERDNYSILRGDVFVTRTSETFDELGMSCVALKNYPNATYNGFTKRLRPITEKVLPEFIGYYLRMPTFRAKFQAFSTMTTRASLRNEELLNLTINLPSLSVQEKIAEALSVYDKLIENNQKQIKLLEEAAQRLYKEWFVDLRFPGYENVKIIDGVPEGWKKGRADSFFPITIGKTPPRSEPQWFVKGKNGIHWVSISDMGSTTIYIFNTAESLTEEAIVKHNVRIIPAGTVMVSFKLTIGRVSIATEAMCTNEAIAHFHIENAILREYTYEYLKEFHYDTLGSTSSISKAVNSKIIKAMPFVVPDYKTLTEYHNIAETLFHQVKCKQSAILALSEARERLLPKLMKGVVKV